jgi:glycosyltransferase involved in cell wall biosynthesis
MADLSVIIPTYNRSGLVVEAVESVLAQDSGRTIEIIVVDDGSTDDTARALAPYSERIRYLHQTNRGMNAARNRGIREASGEYLALLDSDDVWLPFKAVLQVAVLEKLDRVGFVFSNFYAWRDGVRTPDGLRNWMVPGATIAQHSSATVSSTELGFSPPAPPFKVEICEIYRLSLRQPVVLPSTSVIRRRVVDAMGPLPEDNWMCGDWEYFSRASKLFGAAYIDKETALNRSHDDCVRLMRRALTERTEQRLQSIHRTWKADRDFMAQFASEVAVVESKEWATLFKSACYRGDFAAARKYLERVEHVLGFKPWTLRAFWWLAHVPGARSAIAIARSWAP